MEFDGRRLHWNRQDRKRCKGAKIGVLLSEPEDKRHKKRWSKWKKIKADNQKILENLQSGLRVEIFYWKNKLIGKEAQKVWSFVFFNSGAKGWRNKQVWVLISESEVFSEKNQRMPPDETFAYSHGETISLIIYRQAAFPEGLESF